MKIKGQETPDTQLHYFTAIKDVDFSRFKVTEDCAPVQSCPRQYKTSGPAQWDHSPEST